MISVVNQYGRYITGDDYDLIVDANNKGETYLGIGLVSVEIVGVDKDKDGSTIIKVEVKL